MKHGYGQYCPLALATEILGQRWTVLVISRVLGGCRTFNAIHQGVPRMSPSLLSRRLAELAELGIVRKRVARGSSSPTYTLTPAGVDLGPVIEQMAIWGKHWSRDMHLDDLDPAFLAWSMHTRLDPGRMPAGRTVIEFDFTGTPTEFRRFWIVVENGAVEMCLKDPGFPSDLIVRSDIRRFIEAWRGLRDFQTEIRRGTIHVEGTAALRPRFLDWILPDSLSPFPRKRGGRERRMVRT
ncbi:MAG: helix-turn-helix domain-containing protein [Candidatus Eisenbacteria bacterium]|uniref:Helix-turn-helix transcriptional regulator n=1 Tax=Eiseniibacteriota bacterium TaxID=2212470 RepID=A0A956RPC7_UNCEI|nr:helix-turn-helix transcriptional regulator [Candidatus Eisenbacteria bacterium]